VRPPGRSGAHRQRGGRIRIARGGWVTAAAILLVTAAGLTAVVRAGGPARPTAAPVPVAATRAATAAPATEPRSAPASSPPAAVPPTPPVSLRIPTLGLAVGLSQLGLNPDRTVQVPTDFQRPGWFRLGPSPGQPGSAVILGHVDSYRGPAVFFRLRTLKPGDRVEVGLAGGGVARFAVRAVATYPKASFPGRQVYASHGGRSLQLVTCGGQFDYRARSYLSNVVVYTELIPSADGVSLR
jgi:Sortase domain